MVRNGTDMTGEVDLTSDLDGSDDGGAPAAVSNNGGVQQPAGTRVMGQEAPADKAPAAAPPADNTPKPKSVREVLTETLQGQKAPAAPPADGRQRNLDGTFMSPEQIAAKQQADAAAAAPGAQQAPTTVSPPASMSAVEAQVFARLPAEMQQYVARTMESVEQSATRAGEYGDVIGALENRRTALAMDGMTPAQYVTQLTALSDFAGNDPSGFIQWFANSRGLDVTQVMAEAPQVDPQVRELQERVGQLTQQLGGFTQNQQQQAHQNTLNDIVQFASENGQDGKPLRPHFEELGAGVMPYIKAVKDANPNMSNRDILTQAYEQACWATPAVRTKLLAEQDAQRLAAQRATAGRAAAAGSSVTGAPGETIPASTDYGDGSIRSILSAQLARG